MQERYLPLDILRGLTIAMMLIVNTPGSWAYVYAPLLHADWHGCTPTDLVFPFFLFVVGGALVFSFHKIKIGIENKVIALKIVKRTFLIFLIGWLLNAYPFYARDYSSLRIMGVLQRIALSYGFAAILILLLKDKWKIILFSMITLLGYWAILYFGSEQPYSLENNLPRSVDLILIGDQHMWHGKKIAFDPEGILSTISSVVSVLIGYLSLLWVWRKNPHWFRIIIVGTIGIISGIFWGQFFPVNKSLWTSSYVMLSSGWAIVVLGAIQFLYQYKWKKWSLPFIALGSNPLFIFVCSILLIKTYFKIKIENSDGTVLNAYGYIYKEIMVPIFGQMNGSLLFALCHLFLFYLLAFFLYKKKIFIKI